MRILEFHSSNVEVIAALQDLSPYRVGLIWHASRYAARYVLGKNLSV